jgi:hypothetical protein
MIIETLKEFGMAVLWLFLGYLIGERNQKGRE